jgi:hypothetical protein
MSHGTKETLSAVGLWCCVIGAALLASGCYTGKALQLGERHERVTRFSRAFRDGDYLVIPLGVGVKASSDWRAYNAPGWTAVDLGTLAWGPVRRPGWLPIERPSLTLHDGPAPETPVPPYEEISVVSLPLAARENDEAMRREVRAAIRSHSLSAHVVDGVVPVLLFARPDPQAPDGLSMAVVDIEERQYRTWWAIPARAVAVPLMIPVDAIYLPVVYIHFLIYGWH